MDIQQNVPFQEREWQAHRIGWLLFAAVVIAALVGLFGSGPISHSTTTSSTGDVEVRYLRYARQGAPADLSVIIASDVPRDGQVELAVSRRYLRRMDLNAVTPQPQRQVLAGDEIVFTFLVAAPRAKLEISFDMKPDGMGAVTGWVQVPDGERAAFSQFIYP